MIRWFLLLLLPLVAAESDVLRAVRAAALVRDPEGQVRQAERGRRLHPDSQSIQEALVEAYALAGREREAVMGLRELQGGDAERDFADLSEKVAWGVIRRAAGSGSTLHQAFGLLASAAARDIQAVELLGQAMNGSSAPLRAAAVKLAGEMQDAPLAREVERLLEEERVWQVRAEAILAAGRLRLEHLRPQLEKIVADEGRAGEERLAAIEAIVEMLDSMPRAELEALSKSRTAGFRQLACVVVMLLDLPEQWDLIEPLLQDARPDVREAALRAGGTLRIERLDPAPLLDDPEPSVAITAAWCAALQGSAEPLARWLSHPVASNRRRAAGAVRSCGRYGVELARRWVSVHEDPWVRGTLAVGLIEQRAETERAAGVLAALLQSEKGRWSWEGRGILSNLAPLVGQNVRMGSHPEAVNQLTRLEVLSLLAIVEHPEAMERIREFLQERSWDVSGLASTLLLQEGDASALDLVRELLSDPDRKIRVQAALALAAWGKDPEAASTLEAAYPEADREMKLRILESLGRIGSRDSVPFLQEQLEEPFASLRIIAAASLIRCLNS